MPSILFKPRIQLIDSNGDPVVGGYIYTWAAGTSTPKNTYDDYALTTPNPNPIRTGNDGTPSNGGTPIDVYLDGAYKIDIRDANNVSFAGYPVDNVISLSDFDFSGLTASVADLNSTTTTGLLKTANYAIQLTDRGKTILASASAGKIDINLLAVLTAQNGYRITIKKVDTSLNEVEVISSIPELIEGRTSYILYDYNDFIEILCNGSGWKVVASQIRGTIVGLTAAPSPVLSLTDNFKTFNCDASGGSFTIPLPASASVAKGYMISFKKIDSSENTITIRADGSEKIDGLGTIILTGYNEFFGLKN